MTSCATSTIESRKEEFASVYQSLSPEQQRLVDEGKIKVGMPPQAVYMAWGRPAQVLESETTEEHTTVWIYHGQTVKELRFWTFREVARGDSFFLERHLETDYFPQSYIRAEIYFQNNRVQRWRTLPKPPE